MTVKKAVKSFNSMATDINLTSALPSLRSAANATSSRMHELFLPPILETPRSAGHLWARAGRVSPQHFSARDSAPAREHWLLAELLLRSVVSQTGFYWCVFVFGQVDCTTRVSKLSLWLKKKTDLSKSVLKIVNPKRVGRRFSSLFFSPLNNWSILFIIYY